MDELDIQRTISRFANSFDLNDWELMKSTLSDNLTVDYSDLRGEPPRRFAAQDYVNDRRRRTLNTPLKPMDKSDTN